MREIESGGGCARAGGRESACCDMSGEVEFDEQIGVTKYELFIKGVKGNTYTIVVHKVMLDPT